MRIDGIKSAILVVALMLGALALRVDADPGWEGATRKEVGTYIETAVVSGSSFTGTAFISATKSRPDGVYFNNTASTVWIGTTSATQNMTAHDNVKIGFPVLSSATFRLDGSMTGDLYFTCGPTISACEMRKLEGKVR